MTAGPAALVPPAEWAPTDAGRGLVGFWAMLAGPAAGAAFGALVGAQSRRP